MTFTEAAAEVLRLAGKPLHYKEITELAIEKNLLSHVGKSPEVTMGARLAALIKKEDKSQPIVRVRPGVFALRDWEDGKPRKAKASDEERAPQEEEDAEPSTEVNALEVGELEQHAQAEAGEIDDDEEEDEEIVESPEDALRADLAASGADIFDDEEDDDQPILAPTPSEPGAQAPAGEGGRRRRRRRRRRGGDRASAELGSSDGAIEPPAESRDPLAPAPRPMIRDRQQIMSGNHAGPVAEIQLGEGDELAGRDLADAALVVLAAFDRNAGPVALRSIAEALFKRGRLGGDPTLASAQLAAALRGDNLRRQASGQRARFRFSNGSRVAPTEWLLGSDLVRLEQDAAIAVERYRDAARRALLRRIQELPGHAFVELALLALERVGVGQIKVVKRPGSPGGEAHFCGVHRTGADEIRTAIVVRKDGRELGRERVSDLRGALHHYGPASAGWLITTGQVLSGAREEAQSTNAAPIALYDGIAFCKLLEDNEIGVVRTKMTIAIPDLELIEALRG